MSNAGWLCRTCTGPDGQPWRNWSDKTKFHKCRVAKGACFIRKAPTGGGSPTTSIRQGGESAGGGVPGTNAFEQATQSFHKLAAKIAEPTQKQKQLE